MYGANAERTVSDPRDRRNTKLLTSTTIPVQLNVRALHDIRPSVRNILSSPSTNRRGTTYGVLMEMFWARAPAASETTKAVDKYFMVKKFEAVLSKQEGGRVVR